MENVPMTVTDGIMMVEGKGLVASNFTQLWELSRIFALSGMVPKDYLGKPEAIFVAITMGAEIGLSPIASVQNIAVINGRPGIFGDVMLGLVRASNQLTCFSESFEGKFPEDTFRAVCRVQRGNEEPITREFSIEDAKIMRKWAYPKEGLTPWHTAPKRMLQMRARSMALRDSCGDILRGIKMAEELRDYDAELTQGGDGIYQVPTDIKTEETAKKRTPKKGTPGKEAPAERVEYAPLPVKPSFQNLVDGKSSEPQTHDMIHQYVLSIVAQTANSTQDSIEQIAVSNFERFWISFEKWLKGLSITESSYPFCDAEIMAMAQDFPAEYKQACLEISDPTTAERCERVKKRVKELIDMAAAGE